MVRRQDEEQDIRSRPLVSLVDPLHLLQAIKNSFDHSGETEHGVTGLHFENYTIIVRKKTGFIWSIECKFRSSTKQSAKGEKHAVSSRSCD